MYPFRANSRVALTAGILLLRDPHGATRNFTSTATGGASG